MISKLQFVINGKEIVVPIELTQEQLHQICEASNSDQLLTGWEEPENGERCYYIDALCRVQNIEANADTHDQISLLSSRANCYTSEKLANDVARASELLRKLRRFAAVNRKEPIDLNGAGGYTITYNYVDKCLECGITGNWMAVGDILFDSEELVNAAIAEYAEELIWYFTEMKDSLQHQ